MTLAPKIMTGGCSTLTADDTRFQLTPYLFTVVTAVLTFHPVIFITLINRCSNGIHSPTSPPRSANPHQQNTVEEPNLLGAYDEDDEVSPPPNPQRQVEGGTTSDLLASPEPQAQDLPNTITAEIVPQMRTAFSKLCVAPSGVLFENSVIQVGVKHEYRGSQGRVQIFFGNNTGSAMTGFKADIPSVNYMRVQTQGSDGITDGSCVVAPKTQAKLQLMVEVRKNKTLTK